MIAAYIEGLEAFVRLVAGMTIEGDCEDHLHSLEACRYPETGEPGCCDDRCGVYEPDGNDRDVDALYSLIAKARRIRQSPLSPRP